MTSVDLPLIDSRRLRHQTLLDAAVGIFIRFGYRKTSMDEIARAAGVSRQGLYLQFASKEDLYRKAVAHALNTQLMAAMEILSNRSLCLRDRLIGACSEWSGRHVGALGADATDLMSAITSLAGQTLVHYEGQFDCALARAIDGSTLADSCHRAGFSTTDAARAIHATARGLKYSCKSRDEFVKGISVAASLFLGGSAQSSQGQGLN